MANFVIDPRGILVRNVLQGYQNGLWGVNAVRAENPSKIWEFALHLVQSALPGRRIWPATFATALDRRRLPFRRSFQGAQSFAAPGCPMLKRCQGI
jgi:hypothetical protein